MFHWLKRLLGLEPQEAMSNPYTPVSLTIDEQGFLKDDLKRAQDEAELAVFWAEVRTRAEKKLGAKLSDKVWSEERVRENWRQRLGMVKP